MKLIVFIALSLLSVTFCYAQSDQNSIRYIEINYLTSSPITYNSIESSKNLVGIKIINVNKKLVDITNNVQTFDFKSDQPAIFAMFTDIKLPKAEEAVTGLTGESGTFLDAAAIASLSAIRGKSLNKSDFTKLDQQYQALFSRVEKLKSLDLYRQYYNELATTKLFHINLNDLQLLCNTPYDKIRDKTIGLTYDYLVDRDAVQRLGLAGNSFAEFTSKDQVAIGRILKNYLKVTYEQSQEQYGLITTHYSDASLKTLSADVDQFVKAVSAASGPVSDAKVIKDMTDKAAALKKIVSGFTAAFKEADIASLNKKIADFETTTLKSVTDSYNYVNESNYTVYITPQELEVDETKFIIHIKPKNDVVCSPVAKSYVIKIRSKQGLKINFSSGFFVNFGGNSFIDQTYRYDDVDGEPDKSRITRNDTKNKFFPSVGALMHVYTRSGTELQPALSFGVSIKNASKVNFHLGPSLIAGKNQRFILSGGVTLTKTSLISDKYQEGQIIVKSTAATDVPVSDFDRFGYFFSLTYNLSSK